MQSRVGRVMVAGVLLAVGVGAAFQLSFLIEQTQQVTDEERATLIQLTRLDSRLADLSAAQSAYVAPGQPGGPWLERASALTSEINTLFASVRSSLRAAQTAPSIQALTDDLARLAAADTAARDDLQQEQDLTASDVVFGEARDAIQSARSHAVEIGEKEAAALAAVRGELRRQLLITAGGAAGIWVVGLLLLVPRGRSAEAAPSITSIAAEPPRADTVSVVVDDNTKAHPSIDLAAAADLCTSLSRVVSSAALPDMLARTAGLVDASGVIVWMAAGNDLYAAASHGYNPQVIRQLGSIHRDADNATAASWRTGELRTVPGDPMSNGAIVAPMFGPGACIGVLAAEVRHGREQDPPTQAVTMMVAAQLATILGAWPAASPSRAAEG